MTRALLPYCLGASTPRHLVALENVTCCIPGLSPSPDLGAGTTKTPRRVLQAVIVIISTDCRCCFLPFCSARPIALWPLWMRFLL